MQSKKGFTLIELLVVIAIIGILSSVVLASLGSAREKARDARRQSDMSTLLLTLEQFYSSQSPASYPATLAELKTAGLINPVPVDPKTGASYTYAVSVGAAPRADFHLGIQMEGTAVISNDENCNSIATLECFAVALTGGFSGDTVAGSPVLYDRTNN